MTLHLGGITLTEFDVAFTDLLLALESGFFAFLLFQSRGKKIEGILGGFLFLFLGTSSFLGALFHGFFPEKSETLGGLLLWLGIALSIGLVTIVMFCLAGVLAGIRKLSVAAPWVLLFLTIFLGVLIFVNHEFKTIIFFYAPALFFLGSVSAKRYLKRRNRDDLYLALGVALSFVAAAAQFLKIAIHPRYFNHNALYHLLQGAALVWIFVSLRGFSRNQESSIEV